MSDGVNDYVSVKHGIVYLAGLEKTRELVQRLLWKVLTHTYIENLLRSTDTIEFEASNAGISLLTNKRFDPGLLLRGKGCAMLAASLKNRRYDCIFDIMTRLNLKILNVQRKFVEERNKKLEDGYKRRNRNVAEQRKKLAEKRRKIALSARDNSYKSGAFVDR